MTLVIDVRDLVSHPGAARSVRVREPVPGLATQLAAVPDDRPMAADLLLEGLAEGILVTGPVAVTMTLSCARCLRSFDRPVDLRVQEMFAVGAEADDDTYPVVDGEVDLEPLVRDAVVLAMPFAPLCRPGCLGLCSRCGGDLNLGECTCPPQVDPRWAALSDLTMDE